MKSLTYVGVCRRLEGVLCSVMISRRQRRDFRNLQVCQLGSEEERCKPWEKVDHSGARFDLCTVYTSREYRQCPQRLYKHINHTQTIVQALVRLTFSISYRVDTLCPEAIA